MTLDFYDIQTETVVTKTGEGTGMVDNMSEAKAAAAVIAYKPWFWIGVGIFIGVAFVFAILAMPIGRKLILAGKPRKLKR
jgi:uncharacterized membrane protein